MRHRAVSAITKCPQLYPESILMSKKQKLMKDLEWTSQKAKHLSTDWSRLPNAPVTLSCGKGWRLCSDYACDSGSGSGNDTDGVGTKLLLACEQNNLETIGIDLWLCAPMIWFAWVLHRLHSWLLCYTKTGRQPGRRLNKGIVKVAIKLTCCWLVVRQRDASSLCWESFWHSGICHRHCENFGATGCHSIKAGDVIIVSVRAVFIQMLDSRPQITEGTSPDSWFDDTNFDFMSNGSWISLSLSLKYFWHCSHHGGGWRNILRLNKTSASK